MHSSRDHGFDNLRALLILAVVFGHLLEISAPFRGSFFLYRLVYSFHMPAFLFITGYFARFDRDRLLFSSLLPYVLFQTCSILFRRFVLQEDAALQFTTPYWTLWYLMAVIFYQLLIPMYSVAGPVRQGLALMATFLISLAAGFDGSVGYNLTLSRILVFQPWFLLGFYARRAKWPSLCRGAKLAVCMVLCICIIGLHRWEISAQMLFGSLPYAETQSGPLIRFFCAAVAGVWLVFLFLVCKPFFNRPIPLLTALGQHTLPVFLLHGFAVKYLGFRFPGLLDSPLKVLAATFAIALAFGNSLAGRWASFFLSPRWAQSLRRHIRQLYKV